MNYDIEISVHSLHFKQVEHGSHLPSVFYHLWTLSLRGSPPPDFLNISFEISFPIKVNKLTRGHPAWHRKLALSRKPAKAETVAGPSTPSPHWSSLTCQTQLARRMPRTNLIPHAPQSPSKWCCPSATAGQQLQHLSRLVCSQLPWWVGTKSRLSGKQLTDRRTWPWIPNQTSTDEPKWNFSAECCVCV